MTDQNEHHTAAMAAAASILGASVLFIMVLIDGPEKWVFAGLATVVMIVCLVPVLRSIRSGGRK